MVSNSPDLSNLQTDEFIFAQEDEERSPTDAVAAVQPWQILIVDDEAEVHEVTELALREFTFEGRSLKFISAYSAAEAKQLIQTHSDIAIILLDVVMETENAGLQLIRYVREELQNPLVRIILRTGQPGQAPENAVAMNYGTNDYKTKTELTSQKLASTVVTALRTFSTLMQMLKMTQALELQLVRYQQTETDLPVRAEPEDNSLLVERSPSNSPSQQAAPLKQLEVLSHITPMPDAIGAEANPPSNLYTTSTIATIARMVLRITDEHSAKLGISQTKLAVLIYLSSQPERCARPSALAEQCGVSRAAMTGLLDGLEQEGYVERDDHPSDRRALRVKLTPKGEAFLDWIAPHDQSQISELIHSLDKVEQQTLIDLMRNAIALFDEQVAIVED